MQGCAPSITACKSFRVKAGRKHFLYLSTAVELESATGAVADCSYCYAGKSRSPVSEVMIMRQDQRKDGECSAEKKREKGSRESLFVDVADKERSTLSASLSKSRRRPWRTRRVRRTSGVLDAMEWVDGFERRYQSNGGGNRAETAALHPLSLHSDPYNLQ